MKIITKTIVIAAVLFLFITVGRTVSYAELSEGFSTEGKIMVVMGDSISEGVQSGNVSLETQLYTYGNFLASHLNIPLSIPYIESDFSGNVSTVSGRQRLDAASIASNIAVSGADVQSLLLTRNDAVNEDEINSETDLVLYPWLGSQMEVAEYITNNIGQTFIICWIGNNDILSSVTSFDHLDATQMTPVDEFKNDYNEIVSRLYELGTDVVLANIPNVTNIAFLLDRQDLFNLFGIDFGMQDGDFTTVAAALLVKFGVLSGDIFQNPDFVLDAAEVSAIEARTAIFNQYIDDMGAEAGFPVVDVNARFDELSSNPPVIAGIKVTNRFLGGFFSLDGVHPSITGHILLAEEFINTINNYYGAGIPPIDSEVFEIVVLSDPHVDKDGDGKVTGRFGTGLLETLGPILGISGDLDDFTPEASIADMSDSTANSAADLSLLIPGEVSEDDTLTEEAGIELMKKAFGVR